MANTQAIQDRCQVKRIDILPDDVLLRIFDFYMCMHPPYGAKTDTEAWQSLIHVCRQWRNLVLASPRRLDLQLHCTPRTPAKDTLNIWPPLPLTVEGSMSIKPGTENIIAALGQSNRVRRVELYLVVQRDLEEVLATMQVPFPELTRMELFLLHDEPPPVNPDSFLGGSAPPRLQYFKLLGIPFPGLPNFLLSASHLVVLSLFEIPQSGYISPEAIVALLSVLSSLRSFSLGFQSPKPIPSWGSQSQEHAILPVLSEFSFKGDVGYLEELVARIDTPQLDEMHIAFFKFSLPDFNYPRLALYLNHAPKFRACDEAHVHFFDSTASVTLRYRTSEPGSDYLRIEILYRNPYRQLSFIERLCEIVSQLLSMVEDLYIEHRYWELIWKGFVTQKAVWFFFLRRFASVKNIYLSKEFGPGIAATLQGLAGSKITEVLPSLQNIYLEQIEPLRGLLEDNTEFFAVRRLSGHPITISVWDKECELEDPN